MMGCWLLWGLPLVFVCCVYFHWVWWRGAVILLSFVAMRMSGVGIDFLGFGFGGGVGGGGVGCG